MLWCNSQFTNTPETLIFFEPLTNVKVNSGILPKQFFEDFFKFGDV